MDSNADGNKVTLLSVVSQIIALKIIGSEIWEIIRFKRNITRYHIAINLGGIMY